MTMSMAIAGARSVMTRVLAATLTKGKALASTGQVQGALTGVVAYDVVNDLFNPGETFGDTDPQTADGLKKATMAIIQDMEMGGIPLDGLRGRDGQPLPTNWIVMSLEKHRIFPLFKYNSSKVVKAARRS